MPAVFLLASALGLFFLKDRTSFSREHRLASASFFCAMALLHILRTPPPQAVTPDRAFELAAGTLHQAAWKEWRSATAENQLATAQDWIQSLRSKQKLQISVRSQKDLRYWAIALRQCMIQERPTWLEPPIQAVLLAEHCAQRERLLKYRPR